MNKAMRDMLIILVAFGLLVGALYFWLYLQPSNRRQEELETRIQERTDDLNMQEMMANMRIAEYAILSEIREVLEVEWSRVEAALPETFDDARVLEHVQDVLYPHTNQIHLTFNESELREGDELYSTIVQLEFSTSFWQFISILYNLVQGELGNRVVTYNLIVTPLHPDDFFYMMAYMFQHERADEVMPPHIIEQFLEPFQQRFVHGDEEAYIVGMHMINVSMEIEYLSLEGGMLSEDALRALWAEEDAPPEEYNPVG